MSIQEFSELFTGADAITGERLFPGDRVLDTGMQNMPAPYMGDTLTRFVKEDTIVWLAGQAGFDVVKRDARDSGNAEVVDGADVDAGAGAPKAGKAKARGRKSAA